MSRTDIQLSKSLSWLLRHSAVKEGLHLSSEGYLEVYELLKHKSFRSYSVADIERIVSNNEKQRFKLRVNPITQVLEIKANQGHSIQTITEAELKPILEPKYRTVVHGTYLKYWPQIKNQGLSCMKRQHIHLSKGTLKDQTVISGIRKDSEIYIFVDLAKALQDNIKFYESENGVVLTPGNAKGFLESKYFSKVTNIATGMWCDHNKAVTP